MKDAAQAAVPSRKRKKGKAKASGSAKRKRARKPATTGVTKVAAPPASAAGPRHPAAAAPAANWKKLCANGASPKPSAAASPPSASSATRPSTPSPPIAPPPRPNCSPSPAWESATSKNTEPNSTASSTKPARDLSARPQRGNGARLTLDGRTGAEVDASGATLSGNLRKHRRRQTRWPPGKNGSVANF